MIDNCRFYGNFLAQTGMQTYSRQLVNDGYSRKQKLLPTKVGCMIFLSSNDTCIGYNFASYVYLCE
jgi:hypothetical protein